MEDGRQSSLFRFTAAQLRLFYQTPHKKFPIGDSESLFGVYKILAVLGRLIKWSKEEYWPAFKHDVLYIG